MKRKEFNSPVERPFKMAGKEIQLTSFRLNILLKRRLREKCLKCMRAIPVILDVSIFFFYKGMLVVKKVLSPEV